MNYYFKQKNLNKKAIIFFSGMGANKLDQFHWQRSSEYLFDTYDLIFLKDRSECFYINGVPEFSISEVDTAEKIYKNKFYEQWNVCGSSMGGYGAIAFAGHLEQIYNVAVNIIVFNPYVDLPSTLFTNKHLGRNLGEINFQTKANRWCLSGAAKNDLIQSNNLKNNWTHISEPRCEDHNLAQFVRDNNLFKTIMNKFLEIH